jgi:UDP-N-acetylglucosamine--N-acetylmuramyl-(pentapeptide) pyrophosphoryl-undecaprenol N-acetylglucosamine transferase
MNTIVLTGGGTAGHVTPNLAIVPKLKKMGFNIEYIGTKEGMEREIMSGTDIPYHVISAGKLRRYFSLKNFIDPFKILSGLLKAEHILRKLKPAAVFSKGGYVGVPVVMAAHRLGIPVVLHESDYTPGLANRICIPRASRVCVAFETTLKHIPEGKGVYTGLPIREELLHGDRQKGLEFCGFSGVKPVLLIMGGSLGAMAINDVFDSVLLDAAEKFDIVHIRGKQNLISGLLPAGYKQFEYVGKQLADIYAATDIMLSRAGATAVFEILALSIPALLIPLPRSSSRGDQLLNAKYFEDKGFSYVLEQEDLTGESLIDGINRLYENRETLRSKMKSQEAAGAADNVVNVIVDVQLQS